MSGDRVTETFLKGGKTYFCVSSDRSKTRHVTCFCSLQKTDKTLKDLGQKRQAAQADLQPLISKDLNGTSSGLPLKLSAATNKHDDISALAELYNKKCVLFIGKRSHL